MAANQLRAPSVLIGWPGLMTTNSASLALSAAATWLGMQFVPDQTKTLSKVKLFMVTKTGTPLASNLTCDLFSDVSGVPGTSSEGPISADSSPASGNWVQWTFAGTSGVTAGTPYWLVFKNTHATPATNNPTYQWAGQGVVGIAAVLFPGGGNFTGATPLYGWNKVHTTNSGTNWATSIQSGVAGLRLEFTDGTFDGLPVQSVTRAGSGGTADRAFGTQEVGVRFNVPSGATWKVRGAWMVLARITTPGDLRFRLYQDTTLLATSNAIPLANVTTAASGDGYLAYFSSAQTLVSTNNPYRLVFGDATAGDANTTGYNSALYTVENDSNSLALKPMNGTLQKTITADNTASPVVFSDTSTHILPFALLLDSAGELTASGGATPSFGLAGSLFRGRA